MPSKGPPEEKMHPFRSASVAPPRIHLMMVCDPFDPRAPSPTHRTLNIVAGAGWDYGVEAGEV